MKTVKEKYEYLLELIQHRMLLDGNPFQYKHYQGGVCDVIDITTVLRWTASCNQYEIFPNEKRRRMIIANAIYKELKNDRK